MPNVDSLLGLLEEIAKGTPDEVNNRLKTVRELLKKVSCSKAHTHIEIDYDGREFHYKVTVPNMTASEWTPRDLTAKNG